VAVTFALALAVVLRPARAEPPLAVPADGEPFPAQLVAADAGWHLRLETGGKAETLSAAHLAWWGTCAEPARGPILVLADGGLLPADVTGADKDSLAADSDPLGAIKLPLEALAGVVLRPPAVRSQRDRLVDRLVRATGESDRLLLDNGDEVTGLFEAITNGKARVKSAVGPLAIELRRVVAMVFNPALRQKPARKGLAAWVGLGDGSRLLAGRLVVRGDSMEVTTSLGQTWKTTRQQLVFLQPIGGRTVYLSDLRPAKYRSVPYLDLAWPYGTDRSVTGQWLRCGGRLWLKGLGVHSEAHLVYDLDRPYNRFQADAGIDDSTGGRGSAVFRVLVDGKQKFVSGPVRGGSPPVPISVDLAGAKRIELVADFGERADLLGQADWLGARLEK
jgi:hypothetical protein